MKYVPNNTAIAVAGTIHLALVPQGKRPIAATQRAISVGEFHNFLRECLTVGMEINPLLMAYSESDTEAHREMREQMWHIAANASDERDVTRACYLSLWLALHDPVLANANCIRRTMRGHLITYRRVVITTARSDRNAHVVLASRALPDRGTIHKALLSADQLDQPGILFEPVVPGMVTDGLKSSLG